MLDEISKNKAITVSAIMNNKKLSKAIADALNSPVGSSKREKAAAILSVFNKDRTTTSQVLDGKGGGVELDYRGMPVKPMVQNQAGPVDPAAAQLTVGVDPLTGQVTPKKQVFFPSFSDLKPITPSSTGITLDPSGMPVSAPSWLMPAEKPSVVSTPGVTETGQPITTPLIGPQKAPEDYQPPATYPGYEWYDNLSEKDKEAYKPFIESDIAGFSPQTTAWKLMDDMDALKKLGVPEWMLPTHGASLTGQVSALAKTLREETGLTRTENNLRNLQERGMTITDDLSAYIKGKDKYIKNINDMMKKSREHEKTIDMSLPGNQRTMKNYNNYLSILKGRQQNRYIDFLNTGITYHNAELNRATNSYNTAYQNFNRELATQTAITKENYERLNNILMDMYSNVTDREKVAAEKTIMESQVAKAQLDKAKVGVELINLALGIEDSGWSKMTENSQSQAEANYIKSSGETADQAEIDFSYLSEAEKLKWTGSSTADSTEDVQFYVDEILRAEVGGIDSSYYDAETGEIKWTSVPANIRAQVRNRRTEMVAEDQRARAAAAGDKKAKSMGAIEWLKHHLNPFNWGD